MYTFRVILCLAFGVFMTACSQGPETDNAQLDSDISPVIPKTNGTVIEILVDDNQNVAEGDTLVLLDDTAYRIAVKQAELALAIAQQNVQLSKANKGTTLSSVATVAANSQAVEANMASAQAGVDAAKVRLGAVTKEFERFRQLLAQKAATQQQFDGIQAEKEAAEAQLQIALGQVSALKQQIAAAKNQVETTRSNIASSDNGVSLAELSVKQAANNLENAQLQWSYCVIKSPSNGVVSKKNVQKGQVVSIGQPLMAITNDQKVWVVANFKETQISAIRKGQDAEVEVDAYPDQVFEGKVASLSQATGAKFSLLPPDNATGNFVKVTQRIPVKIELQGAKDPNYPLRAGMSVNVKIKTKENE